MFTIHGYGILSIILTVYIIILITLLILDNREPDKTIAWILIIIFIPILGLLIYFYMGQSWKKKGFIQFFKTETMKKLFGKTNKLSKIHSYSEDKGNEGSQLQRKLSNQIRKTIGLEITSSNKITMYFSGKNKFDSLISEISKAKKFIHIEYYRIKNDYYGKRLRDVLLKKANEGVEIRLLCDFYGSLGFVIKNTMKMRASGIKMYSFFNPFLLFSHHKMNYRNHRKIVIIDATKSFIGGMNIGEEYITGKNKFKTWKDMHALVEGNVVTQLETIFIYDWYLNRKKNIVKDKYFKPEHTRNIGNSYLQVIYSGPESIWQPVKQSYFNIITNSNKSVWITTPYFIPDEGLILALKNAALSGLDVRIIVPSKADHYFPFHASRTYFEELMDVGVDIYEYKKGFMHSKCIIGDSSVVSFGTANFDIRSFSVNFESNLVIYSKKDVKIIETELKDMMKDSHKIDKEKFKKRGWITKAGQSLARLLSPIL